MAKPESFPFLRIAREFGVDYGAVLRHADSAMYGHCAAEFTPFTAIDMAIVKVVTNFVAIRAGDIDWRTGERAVADCPKCGGSGWEGHGMGGDTCSGCGGGGRLR